MVNFRLIQFSEIFLVSAIASRLLFWLLPRLPIPASISLGLGVFAGVISAWTYWWLDSGRGTFPEIALVAVVGGILISTWF